MKNTIRSVLISSAMVVAFATSLPAFSADKQKEQPGAQMTQPPGSYGYGPGMMGGYGGYGMGPGMMGGYGGYGMGPGMMGGYGMGPGMMGGYGGGNFGFTEAQQAKVGKIMDETRKANWGIMGAMMDQQAKLRDLYTAPKRDEAAIAEEYKNIGQLRQQMFDNMVNAQKRMDEVLTKEQRERLRSGGGWGGMPGY
ncbi:MAG: periplasmic heavy metal sensor [Betaproteobacteria bacterium]|nr:periplasmic heavy metal sensor [Betaproteobacteria bacterium]